ncbi:MAG: GntR family transcriptional regulator [Solirubrobacterales bacterium]|nr:GntR family transcriptional regulator [Solirubrobacterales bacterium]
MSAAERVYAQIKEEILGGALPGGALLSEGEVAKRLAVSRTPAREAFVRLAAEDLLSLLPRRGAVVTPLSSAVDLLETRHALETSAVARLARLADRERRLAGARAALEAQLEAGDVAAFVAADERFHLELVRASGNELAAGFYATLGDRQRRMTTQAINLDAALLSALAPEHRGLLELAEAGGSEAFSKALWEHLRNTHAALAGL